MSAAQTQRVEWELALVQRASRGDVRAFERLYRDNVGRVYGLCLRLTRHRANAEDCTQEAFINAWRALEHFENRSAFGTWMHRIAVNVVLNRRRRSGAGAEADARAPSQKRASELQGAEEPIVFDTPIEEAEIERAVDAEVFAAAVDVRTVNGDIRLQGHGETAHITANSVSGDVRLSQGAGDVQATSISGDLQLGIDPAGAVHLRTTSGDITIEGGLAPEAMLDMNTVSGRVDLQAAAPAGFSYDISSFSGDIHDCFGQQSEHVSQFGPGTRLSGSRGAGRSSLRIRTLSGDVSLCDRAPHRP